jgi:GT2 family glycosyltransferase/glycosyltransferase involved in cell wall biosynthesis/Tfp pilus assembly protein PilF
MAKPDQVTSRLQQYFCDNDLDGASSFLGTLLANPELPPAQRALLSHALGRIRFYARDYDAAGKFFRDSLASGHDGFYSKFYLGRIAEETGDEAAALKVYSECLRERRPFTHIVGHMHHILGRTPWQDPSLGNLVHWNDPPPLLKGVTPPRVTVIVLCYNKVEYTIRCLDALFRNTDYPDFEVIAVDNASVDDTAGYLETWTRRITVIHAGGNLGFVHGNNLAAGRATGAYIVFLNNDTEVQPGWLTEMEMTFRLHPKAGAVGARLVYPSGIIQEAGGVIFSDATGWNYGRGLPLQSSLCAFSREVDYCSGAALMVRADIFRRLGGFDARYAPAYCEDSDLCFGVRKLGYTIVYSPSAVVLHHEGATAGTDTASGFKRYQEINAPKFAAKWGKELARQYPNDPALSYRFSDRRKGKRVLIIDDWPPLPDKASGTLRMYNTLKQMLALGCRVTYVHLVAKNLGPAAEQHLLELRGLGVETLWFEYELWYDIRNDPAVNPTLDRLVNNLELRKRKPDVVYLSFWHVASYFIDRVRAALPSTPVIVDTHDIHYLREERQGALENDERLKKSARANKKKELHVYAKADCVTTVTAKDREVLQKDLPEVPILIMTNVHDPVPVRNGFDARKDFLFVGNFNHGPNEDAVLHFVQSIFPAIRREIPDSKFLIVGNNPTPKVKSLASDAVIVTGWVPSVVPYIESAKVSVVPLRYGAGVKGKVGETFAHGLPTVMTSIGAEGMNIINGEHAFVTDDPSQFAACAVSLYRDSETWEKFSRGGRELVAAEYSSAATRRRLEYLFSFETREAFTSYRAHRYATPPDVSIVIVTFNQFDYTQKCLESIREHTRANHEIIVVDNGSTDGTAERLRGFPEVRLIANDANLGFPAAVNQGINAAIGTDVLLLNNDTVVTDGWLERFMEILASDSSVGLVGPVSNFVSGIQCDPEARYRNMNDMHAYAARAGASARGETLAVPRVAFLCTLIRGEVIRRIGGLDERFTPGNYEDDDYCLRSVIAGFKSAVAKDVFIHHYGSKSFLAEGRESYNSRLKTNREIFIAKWGADPDEIWSGAKQYRKRNVHYPLDRDPFIQAFERGRLHAAENELALAMSWLRCAVESYHDSERRNSPVEYTDVLHLAANVALVTGDLESAKGWLEEELSVTPGSARACAGLGAVFEAAGEDRSAKTMFEWSLKNDPSFAAGIRGLASVNLKLGLDPSDTSLGGEPGASTKSNVPPESNVRPEAAREMAPKSNVSPEAAREMAPSLARNVAPSLARNVAPSVAPPAPPPPPALSGAPEDITAVNTDSAFAREVRSLFARIRPMKILETGTFVGNGTTNVIASALRDLGSRGAKFYSIEVNPGLHAIARRNLEKAGLSPYVNLLNGLSVPRSLLPGMEEIERRTVKEIGKDPVYVDHAEKDRVEKYYNETNFPGVADDLIGRVLGVFGFRPDFVLLDSGGHMGTIEFTYLISRLEGECHIALDDIFHVKHRESFSRMSSDPRFEIIAAVREKAGFCIARFTPGASVTEDSNRCDSEIAQRLSQAGEQFRKREFHGALETLETVDRLVAAIPDSAPHGEAVAGIETVRGMSYLGLSDIGKAKAAFEKALSIQPRSSQACAGLGEVFYLAGLDREAKVMFEHAVALGQANQFGRSGLAKSNEALGLPVEHNSLVEKGIVP